MRSDQTRMAEMLKQACPSANPRVKFVRIGLNNGTIFTLTDFQIERGLLMGRSSETSVVCMPLVEVDSVELVVNGQQVRADKLPMTFEAVATGAKP